MLELMKVLKLTDEGAILEGESHKNLLLPAEEERGHLAVGDNILVFIDEDDLGQFASMRLEDFIKDSGGDFKDGQQVDLVISSQTDLGFKAAVNGTHWGVLYSDEVFQPLHHGQKIKGYIKKVREDRKLDLILQDPAKIGHRSADDIGPLILDALKEKNGFLPINDKTEAEKIYDLFGVSKKKFKIALGGLYKRRLITVDDDGIRLTKR